MIDPDAVIAGTVSEMRADIKALQASMEGDNGVRVRLATLETTVASNATTSGERHTATQSSIGALSTKVDELSKGLGAKLDALATANQDSSSLFDIVSPKTVAGVIIAIASMLGLGMGAVHATSAPTDPPPTVTSSGSP